MKKRLYKSAVNKKLCGVCGGIAEYFDIDPTIIRLAWVVVYPSWRLGYYRVYNCGDCYAK